MLRKILSFVLSFSIILTIFCSSSGDIWLSASAEVPKYTYYFLAPDFWCDVDKGALNSNVGIYWWSGPADEKPAAWPGFKMKAAPEVGKNVFKYSVPNNDYVNAIVINAYVDSGVPADPALKGYAHQTCDVDVESDDYDGMIYVLALDDAHMSVNPLSENITNSGDWYKLSDYKKSYNYGTYSTYHYEIKTPPVDTDQSNPKNESEYKYSVSNGNVKITKYTGSASSLTIPSTLGGYPVTSIGDSAFNSCTSLTSVTIPNSVTNIECNAFDDCTSLVSVTIPNSVTIIESAAFQSCKSLTNITIPDSVTIIEEFVFNDCSSLKSVTIPDSVTSIGACAFYGCDSLKSITIPKSVKNIDNEAFYELDNITLVCIDNYYAVNYADKNRINYLTNIKDCFLKYKEIENTNDLAVSEYHGLSDKVEIPNSFDFKLITTIEENAFCKCDHIKEVTIPNSVTNIGDSAFSECSSLTKVTMQNSVESIGNYSFKNCKSLTSVTLSDSVTSIGEKAFENCTSLTSITIPNSVIYIGDDAFLNNPWVNSFPNDFVIVGNNILLKYKGKSSNVNIPNNVTIINDKAFDKCEFITSITMPNSLKSIERQAFSYCTALKEITIPNSVTKIGSAAFGGCISLEDVKISNSVKEIGYMAFQYCSSITSITIPNSVTHIYDRSFSCCSSLNSVVIPSSVTYIDHGAFDLCESLTLKCIDNTYAENFAKSANIPYVSLKSSDLWKTKDLGNNKISITKYTGDLTDVDIPSTLNGKTVTAIGEGAFQDCTLLQSVLIPKSVTSLEKNSFSGCISLKAVSIPNTVNKIGRYSFYNTPWIKNYPNDFIIVGNNILIKYKGNDTSVSVPNTVKSISGAFAGCKTITDVKIPNSVVSIDSAAFDGCSVLENVFIPESVTNITNDSFWSCKLVTLTCTSTYSQSYADKNKIPYYFTNEDNTLKALKSKDGIVSIVKNLSKSDIINIPNEISGKTITHIADSAFEGSNGLTEINIPKTVTSIGVNAFKDCTNLSSVNIPNTVTYIGEDALENTKWLDEFPDIFVVAGDDILIKYKGKGDSINIWNFPQNVKHIGDGAFKENMSITSIKFNNSLISIGANAFKNCKNLGGVVDGIPESVTTIGDNAFDSCQNLPTLTIRETAVNLGKDIFKNVNMSKFKLKCYEGSAIAKYAEKYDINCIYLTKPTVPVNPVNPDNPDTPDKPTVLKGDLDGDGYVTSADSLKALRASVGLEILDDAQKSLADVDNDGYITSADSLMILRASVGLEKL